MKGVDLRITLTVLLIAILIFLIVFIACGWMVLIPLADVIIAILIIALIVKAIRKKKDK